MKKLFLLSFLILFHSCSSYEQFQYIVEEYEMPTQVFDSDYNLTWQAVIKIMSSYDLATKSQETGVLKTRWEDNTMQMNFSDSFSVGDAVKAAKFKLIINVVKGYKGTREVSKVTIYKRQMIEKDFLQGWKVIRSDGIQEKTILYRIGRVISLEKKLKEIEEKKAREEEASF
ncbi:hypothetical protein HBN50_13215 [Halobacteriovorax sp. GB3]|uniref:hypothetical protein n=1 Tax=Halobacteriovorax sp. GB3 TaxID=2719615 RepID=UPI002362092A|nr:hypothetical protein [Halobacteriovorax sp. GB3]MDD0854066.1 hypothetical protein [Halobacteriovorax sp. GB3]